MLRVLAGLGLALISTLAVAQSVSLDHDTSVDFSRYKTFAWSPAQQPAENQANHVRVTRGVERELGSRGLAKAEGAAPDVWLRYYGKIEKKTRAHGYAGDSSWEPGNVRTMVDITRVKQGTLIVEIEDASSRSVVWRATATDVVAREDLLAEQIEGAVRKLMALYPPPAEPAPSPRP